MRPTNHKQKDEELIAHIKQSLKTHEERYQLGAWERFNEKQQAKKRPIWFTRWSAAAAILIACFSIIWYTTSQTENGQIVAKGKTEKHNSTPTAEPNTDAQIQSDLINGDNVQDKIQRVSEDKVLASNYSAKRNIVKHNEQFIAQVVEPATPSAPVVPDNAPVQSAVVGQQVENAPIIASIDNKAKSEAIEVLSNDSQKAENRIDKLAINKKQSKWDMSLMLAPSFGSTNELNMSYGFNVSYNLTNRLSLNSGVSYNKMNASKNLPTNLGMSSIVLGNTKSLEMINEEVTGLDIPLELKYNVNKNVYANFGVSGFAVLNQNRSNTFVEAVVIKSTSNANGIVGSPSAAAGASNPTNSSDPFDAGAKGQFANSYIINQRTTERANKTAIDQLNFIGFYNLSIGYTKKVYKNHALSIEPFIKLPIKMVTQDQLRLVGTGVRLKAGF